MNEISELLTGKRLENELTVIPENNDDIRYAPTSQRLERLSDLYGIYIPSQMSIEIYNKLYLSLLHSLQKKKSNEFIIQHHENHKAIIQQEYRGIIGGSDSFTIIGISGIGKSSAIERAISLISNNQIIEFTETKVIPFVVVQCPFDSSVKGLLLEILRRVDSILDTNYYSYAVKSRATTDMLIGSVSQVALNHIGILVVDEIQNVVTSNHGDRLVGMLTQLINNSGISICMVGTPDASKFFEQKIQLARRSLGLRYGAMQFDDYFENFCKTVFNYQYVKNRTEISSQIIHWLYEHSAGITSVIISLIHDAQELAIMNGTEALDIYSLNLAYEKRMEMLHGFIEIVKTKSLSKPKKKTITPKIIPVKTENFLTDSLKKSREDKIDILKLLKSKISVEVIKL